MFEEAGSNWVIQSLIDHVQQFGFYRRRNYHKGWIQDCKPQVGKLKKKEAVLIVQEMY